MLSSSSDSDEHRRHSHAVAAPSSTAFASPVPAAKPSISPRRKAPNATPIAALSTPVSAGSGGARKPKMSLDEYLSQLHGSATRQSLSEQPRRSATSTARQLPIHSSDGAVDGLCLHAQSERKVQDQKQAEVSPLKQRQFAQDYESSEDDEWLKSLGTRVFKEPGKRRPQRVDVDACSSDSEEFDRRERKQKLREGGKSQKTLTASSPAQSNKRQRVERCGRRPSRSNSDDWSSGVDLLSSDNENAADSKHKAHNSESIEQLRQNNEDEDEEVCVDPYPSFSFAETSENERTGLGFARGRAGYIPAAIARYLRPYQIKGVQWLWKAYASADRNGAILGDDMGLGKTVQVIAFLAAVLGKLGNAADKKRIRARRRGLVSDAVASHSVLIVCPSSVLAQWHDHLQQWGHFAVRTLQGDSEEKAAVLRQVKQKTLEVVLTSYDMLRRYDVALRDIHWHVAVFDEFHILKNPKSAATISARMLPVDFRIGLTGTPIQNNLEELWCLLNVLAPRRFVDKKSWKDHFSNPIKRAQKKSASEEAIERGRQRQKELQRLLNSYMLCRTKAVIEHELKGKDDIIVFCELSDLQKTIYRRLMSLPDFHNARYYRRHKRCGCRPQPCKHKLPMLPDQSGLDERAVLWLRTHDDHQQGCTRCPTCVIFSCLAVLQKVANHPFLLQVDELDPNPDKRAFIHEFAEKALGPEILSRMGGSIRSQRFTEVTRADMSGKMETLTKLLERFRSKNDKVLLFSFSTQMLDLLQAYMKSKGYSHLRLDGRTPTSKRQQLIDEFNTTSSLFVFLISTRAGGLGLNLTSANKVIVFDVNWNPSYDMQAQDRAFRIGQQRHVQVFRLVAQGTVEELCYMRQVYKLQLTQAAMSKSPRATTPRHFEGVDGEEHGELFGIENLLQFMDGSILKTIRSTTTPTARPFLGDTNESQSDLQTLMREVVAKALNDVRTSPAADMDASQSSDILEDPSALLAALGVMGTNMAADEMLTGVHTQHSLEVLTHESDDEFPPEASPTIMRTEMPRETIGAEVARQVGVDLAQPSEATSSTSAAVRKRKLADVFVRGVRKHPPPAPAKRKAATKSKSTAPAKAKPKPIRPVNLYVPDYLRKDK